LHEGLNANRLCAILRKGMEPNTDSYSGFRNNWNAAGRRPPTGLAGYLRERGIDSVFCCGLARDVCVKWTAEDAAYSAEGCHPFRCESCHLIHAKVATQSRGTLPPVGAKRRGMVHCYSEGVGVVKFA
jgi:hypothetical protein